MSDSLVISLMGDDSDLQRALGDSIDVISSMSSMEGDIEVGVDSAEAESQVDEVEESLESLQDVEVDVSVADVDTSEAEGSLSSLGDSADSLNDVMSSIVFDGSEISSSADEASGAVDSLQATLESVPDSIASMSDATSAFASSASADFDEVASSVDSMGADATSSMSDAFAGPVGFIIAGVAQGIFNKLTGAFSDAFTWIHGFVSESMGLVATQIESETKLEAALSATGEAAGFTAGQLKVIASELQSVTTFGDETTLASMALLSTFRNIKGDVFVEVTERAMDMSTLFGGDLRSNTQRLARALDDPIRGLLALSRVGIVFNDQQRDQIKEMVEVGKVAEAQGVILKALEERVGGAAQAMATTWPGAMTQLSNRFGDLREEIAGALIPVFEKLEPAADRALIALENSIPVLESTVTHVISVGDAIMDYLKPSFDWMTGAGLIAFTSLQIAVENWADALTAANLMVSVSSVRTFETIAHHLNTVLPATLAWFADNWIDVFKDIFTAQDTILTNAYRNVIEFGESLKEYLSTGSADFKFTALLEGFESTISELPEIAARVPSALERSLQAELNKVNSRLSKSLAQRFAENREFLNRVFEDSGVDDERPDLTPADVPFDETVSTESPEGDEADEKKEEDEQEVSAQVENTPVTQGAEDTTASIQSLFSLSDRITAAAASDLSLDLAREANQQRNSTLGLLTDIKNNTSEKPALPVEDDLAEDVGGGFDSEDDFDEGMKIPGVGLDPEDAVPIFDIRMPDAFDLTEDSGPTSDSILDLGRSLDQMFDAADRIGRDADITNRENIPTPTVMPDNTEALLIEQNVLLGRILTKKGGLL